MKTLLAAIVLIAVLSGCATEAVKPGKTEFVDSIGDAATALAKAIARQVPAGTPDEPIPVDEVVNETSAEVSRSSAELQTHLTGALKQALPGMAFQPLSSSNLSGAKWIVLTSFRPIDMQDRQNAWIRLRTALVDKSNGQRIAFAEAYLQSKAFDSTPSRYFGDAPMYNLNDAAFRAKQKSIAGSGGQELGMALGLAATYAEAIAFYNDGQFAVASDKFFEVLSVDPGHLGAFSGLYQSYWQRGLKTEADRAFAMLAEASVDSGSVSAKLLFSVGTTNFIPNQNLADQYAIWQKGLARAANTRRKCMDVVGHASRTGQESFNEALSLQRAARIVSNMVQFVPALRGKLAAIGKGSSQTIVGIGTDDSRDAIDRRVEFLVRSCSQNAR